MRVLVTGASGYIGRQAVPLLRARDHDVITAGREADLLSPGAPGALIARTAPEAVLHLAWEATPGVYWTSPDNPRWTAATVALASAAREAGVRRFVGAGSCAEYDWTSGECNEGVTPETPATPYGLAKLAAGREVAGLMTPTFTTAWARVFFLFGDDEYPSRLVPSVARAILAGLPARCTHGEQVRDFLHVRDVAAAMIALLESQVTGPVNIASGTTHRVRDVIEGLASRLGRPDLVRLGEIPTTEPLRLVTRGARLRDEVGWRPQWTFDDALDLTAAYWMSR